MSRAEPILTVTAQVAAEDAFGVQDDVALMRNVLIEEDVLAVFRPCSGDIQNVASKPAYTSTVVPCFLPFMLCLAYKNPQNRYYKLLKTYYVVTSSSLYTVVTDEEGALVEEPVRVPYDQIVRVIPTEQATCTKPPSVFVQTTSRFFLTKEFNGHFVCLTLLAAQFEGAGTVGETQKDGFYWVSFMHYVPFLIHPDTFLA